MLYTIDLQGMEFHAFHGCYDLEQRVATNIIEALHARFPAVRHVRCTVAKLAPPLGGKIARVSVTLEG